MKLRQVTIDGLRGAPVPWHLKLDGKSLLLHGENGHGKSTVADGLELWSTGDIASYDRRGAELAKAIHVDCAKATITVSVAGDGAYERTLSGPKPSDLTDADGERPKLREAGTQDAAPPLGDLPMLRHETMGRFMAERPGPKKKELLRLLGLDELVTFRGELKTACNNIKDMKAKGEGDLDRERAALDALGGDQTPLDVAGELRKQAALSSEISTEEDLASIPLDPPISPASNCVALVAELRAAAGGVPDDPSEKWNALVADSEVRANAALGELVAAGRAALTVQDEDMCPLCGSAYDHEQLAGELRDRAQEYAETRKALDHGRAELAQLITSLTRVEAATGSLRRELPSSAQTEFGQLEDLERSLKAHADEVNTAGRDLGPLTTLPSLPTSEMLDTLDALASAEAGSDTTTALIRLASLRDQAARLIAARAELEKMTTLATSTAGMLGIVEKRMKAAIRTALDDLSELIERYYAQLAYNGLYSDIRLEYTDDYAGGVEFRLTFDGRKAITPPQAIMSTSQLNALGLAMFLARAKKREPNWRTMVLDDVVNSFDSSFRQGLIRILASDFDDWQIILLSHDRAFGDLVEHESGPGWRHWQIVRWTPAGGPILGEGNALARLRELLDEGAAANECAGWARQALEGTLGRVVSKLGYEVPYRPGGRYSAGDFIRSLHKGLKKSNQDLSEKPVLDRIEGGSYMTALGVHEREDASALAAADFKRLADDLDELLRELHCAECKEPVWKREKGQRHTCKCERLVA